MIEGSEFTSDELASSRQEQLNYMIRIGVGAVLSGQDPIPPASAEQVQNYQLHHPDEYQQIIDHSTNRINGQDLAPVDVIHAPVLHLVPVELSVGDETSAPQSAIA